MGLKNFPPQGALGSTKRQAPLAILDPRQQPQMDQEPTTRLPMAMDWDAQGELCPEDLHHLLDHLQAQEEPHAARCPRSRFATHFF